MMDKRIEEIKKLRNKGTPGTWLAHGRTIFSMKEKVDKKVCKVFWEGELAELQENIEKIKNAPNDIRILLSEIESLQDQLKLESEMLEDLRKVRRIERGMEG